MKWYLAAALLLFAAVILESALLAYATYVLWSVLVITRLLARTWLDKLTATRQGALATAEIGDKVGVSVTLRNTGAIPVPWVLVEDMLPRKALDQRRLRV